MYQQILKLLVGHFTAIANFLEVVVAAQETIILSKFSQVSSAVVTRWISTTTIPNDCWRDGSAVQDCSWLRFFALMLHMQCHSFLGDLQTSDASHKENNGEQSAGDAEQRT